jgi:ABC-type multidrug transport system fused ATPase/permease subunit
MRQLTRLIRYAAPYWWPVGASVLLMAAVGLLDAFRLLLIGPIFDRVPSTCSSSFLRTFRIRGRSWRLLWLRLPY